MDVPEYDLRFVQNLERQKSNIRLGFIFFLNSNLLLVQYDQNLHGPHFKFSIICYTLCSEAS